MCVNSLSTTVTRQRRDCDLNPGPSAPESSTLTTRLPSHPKSTYDSDLQRAKISHKIIVSHLRTLSETILPYDFACESYLRKALPSLQFV